MLQVLEAMAIDRLEKSGDARIPRSWSSCRTYERLIEKGLVVELNEPNPLLRRFSVIKHGADRG